MNWKPGRPTIMWAITAMATIAVLVIIMSPEHIELIAGGAMTGIGMLGMKLLEGE